MMHTKRRWVVSPVATAQELAAMLTQRTWTLCSGFYVETHPQYLFLNDATHEDGAGEFGVCRKIDDNHFVQVESITFSWASVEAAIGHITAAISGEFDANEFAHPVDLHGRLDRSAGHRCHLCA